MARENSKCARVWRIQGRTQEKSVGSARQRQHFRWTNPLISGRWIDASRHISRARHVLAKGDRNGQCRSVCRCLQEETALLQMQPGSHTREFPRKVALPKLNPLRDHSLSKLSRAEPDSRSWQRKITLHGSYAGTLTNFYNAVRTPAVRTTQSDVQCFQVVHGSGQLRLDNKQLL